MAISYELRARMLDSAGAISIDEARYDEICHARETLLHALYMEEKLDILLENYVEYEEALLNIGLSRMVFQRNEWTEFRNDVHLVNRRMVNLLSACRAYLDHVLHHVGRICSPSERESEALQRAKKEQYDSVFGYRVMESLRDYVQHRGFPVQSSEFGAIGEWCGGRQVQVFTVDPFLEPAELSEDDCFKKAVLDEMTQHGDAVYLKPLVRQYVSSMAEIHRRARSLVNAHIVRGRKCLESAVRAVGGEDGMSALVAVTDDSGTCTDRVCLSLESERRREVLCKRNSCLGTLDHRFVSGVCRDDTEGERDDTQESG